jgi:hypothetical protein
MRKDLLLRIKPNYYGTFSVDTLNIPIIAITIAYKSLKVIFCRLL